VDFFLFSNTIPPFKKLLDSGYNPPIKKLRKNRADFFPFLPLVQDVSRQKANFEYVCFSVIVCTRQGARARAREEDRERERGGGERENFSLSLS